MLNRRLTTSPAEPTESARGTTLDGVGAELRAARLALGEELHDAAEALRIKPAYLDALERGDAEALPAGPYALGFLKAYAEHLGLDPAPLLARWRSARRPAPALELAPPDAPVGGRRPAGALLVASLLLAAGLFAGYRLIAGGPPAPAEVVALPPDLPPPEPEVPAAVVAAAAPAEVAAPPAPPPAPAAAAAPAPAPAAAPPPAPVGDAASAVAAENVVPAPPPAEPPVRVAALDVDGAPPADPADAPAGGRVAIVARESSWVQVRSAAGDFVRTRTMEPGETLVLPDRADLALWTGNAGGVELLLDGRSVGRAGAPGAVVRDLILTPEGLQRRAAAAPGAAAPATP